MTYVPNYHHFPRLSQEQKKLLDQWRGLTNSQRDKYQSFSKFVEAKEHEKPKN